jgi:hypothetical protein
LIDDRVGCVQDHGRRLEADDLGKSRLTIRVDDMQIEVVKMPAETAGDTLHKEGVAGKDDNFRTHNSYPAR